MVRQITRELPGAIRFAKRVDVMSTHPEAYRQLRASPDLVAKIALTEAQINAREMAYVPKERVAQDLATYVASISSHTGIMVARPLEVT